MRLTPLRRTGLLASAAAAAVATLALTSTASAQAPTTDDKRATPYTKNVDINHPEACTVGGLTGETIHPSEFTYTGGDNEIYLNVTGVPAGLTVTGVVVKGGPNFNVYLAKDLGPLPWNELRSPFNEGGQQAQISHWYGCGIEDETPSSSVTPSSSTSTSTSTSSSSSAPTSASTTVSSSEVAVTTTTTAAVAPVVNEDNLASTGFGSAWLVGLGAALLAAGAAVLLVLRRRRA
ncbi:LPXTG cell wall anchor domain-containing protein [Lentzea sp. PSKA42]|uniref:LPXTG cell wall anchor domain-containing protein n=1 Tax=Lentzea indica TaxID=2604800 RepID=A0ABX1FC23_9PSEU|nr:LPXTG cell wall anchor domain-containing protein [Lentzea indica]NKE56345.1 LPXTG cell wall anchor domain-containing protein [Lentzea indica]